MNKINLKNVNEVIYHETLDNGLDVFIYKKPSFQKKYAYFQTKYGSINNSFIPIGKKEIKSFPLGIAHFLEHKLFESEDNENVFKKFEENGAFVNAATSYDRTFYYFNTTNNFYNCLKILLNFVQSPYFTDDNVEKEKGIISQEIDMCNDDPNRFLYQKLISNVLKESYYKHDIAGSKEEINKITKEDLYECYNTFYNPSNMFIVIAGDVDYKKTIKLIKENVSDNALHGKIKQLEVKEPSDVDIKFDEYKHNILNKKVGIVYKTIFPKMKAINNFLFTRYIDIYLRILFGPTSNFNNYLVRKKVVLSYFEYDYQILNEDTYSVLIYFTADANDEKVLEEEIKSKINNKNDMKKMFDLYKKTYLSSFIKRFESIDSVVDLIRNSIVSYNEVYENYYDLLESLNYEDFKKAIDKLNYDNKSVVIINPKE